MKTKLFLIVNILCLSNQALALTPQVGDVTDNRTTGQFSSDLNVDLKLLGDEVSDIKAIRVDIEKAQDDSGKDLVNPNKVEHRYQEISEYSGKTVKLALKNPTRKAANFNLSGTVSAILPIRDPSATITINKVLSQSGSELKNPSLSAAKISFSLFTKADLEKAKEEEKKKAAEASKTQETPTGVTQLLQSAFMGSGTLGPNEIQYKVVDPDNKLVSLRLLKANGEEIRRTSYSAFGETRNYNYSEAIPADCALELTIATDKSIEKVPFAFTNVYLP